MLILSHLCVIAIHPHIHIYILQNMGGHDGLKRPASVVGQVPRGMENGESNGLEEELDFTALELHKTLQAPKT